MNDVLRNRAIYLYRSALLRGNIAAREDLWEWAEHDAVLAEHFEAMDREAHWRLEATPKPGG